MALFSKIIREPLVHFFLIGAAVFGLYALAGDDPGESVNRQIVVTEGRVQQLAQVFAKTWQRPPTPEEMRGLIDAFVKEEIYYREAVNLGLDRDDTLIRRRMQQKMEFVTEPDEAALVADEATLQAYLDANKAAFRVAPRIAFEQVFVRPKGQDEPADARAKELLEELTSGTPPINLGDQTLLPASVPLSPLAAISRDFGDAFADTLATLPLDTWSGPVRSPYGLHLVRVSQRIEGYDPKLDEVRKAVEQRWRTDEREAFQRRTYAKLRSQYEVILPSAETTEATDLKTTDSDPARAEQIP